MADTNKITYVSLGKLGYYDEKLKAWVTTKDEALQANINKANEAIEAEATRAKAAELTNAQAAQAAQTDVDNLEAYVGTFTASEGVDTVVKYIDAKTANIASDETVSAISDRVEVIEKDYLKAADKTELSGAIADEKSRAEGIESGLRTDVNAIKADYLVEADKTELSNAIALKADNTALEALSKTVGNNKTAIEGTVSTLEEKVNANESDIEGKMTALTARVAANETAVGTTLPKAIADEKSRAEGVEAGLEERLVEVETFFKTTEGQTIDDALDTLVELQKYLSDEGAVADQMVKDIAANAKAIEDEETARSNADTALDERLQAVEAKFVGDSSVDSKIEAAIEAAETYADGLNTAMDTRVDALEAINHEAYIAADTALKTELNTEIAKKADQTALNSAIATLEDADAEQVARIAALEGKFGDGEGSVEDMIADAKQEAIDAAAGDATSKANKALEDAKAYADAEDAKIESRVGALETASATHALASDLTTLAGRVTTAEGEIDTLQSEMDAVEALAAANKAAHEANAAAIALKASQNDLNAVSNRVTTLETWHNNFTEATEGDIDSLFV